MKKIVLATLLCFVILLGITETFAHASTTEAKVKEVEDDAILLDDGTLWLKKPFATTGYFKYETNAVTIQRTNPANSSSKSLGLTNKGELVYWYNSTAPTIDKNQTNIKQLDGSVYLKHDGTVWDVDGNQFSGIKDAVIISGLANINKKGEVRAYSRGDVLTVVDDPESIISFKTYDTLLAYLDNKGKVIALDEYDFDIKDKGFVYNPIVVAEDAVNIEFHASGALIVTKKNGTVWLTDPTANMKDQFKLVTQIASIKDAVKVTDYYGTLAVDPNAKRDPNETIFITSSDRVPQWLVKHKDGSWKIYRDNKVYPIEAPTVSSLSLTASSSKLTVGNTVSFKTVQSYNNGYKETLNNAKLTFDKPYLVKAQKDGSYKTVAVGETKVSVNENGTSKTVTLSISSSSNLSGAISKDNTTYLPLVSVFKALGATVNIKGGNTFDISLGDTKLQLKTGQKKATLNGKEITLNQPVQVLGGSTVFPAALLSKASIASIEWDKKYKKVKISVGKATMVVNSAETAAIEKKEQQGTLAKYINKSYWVNSYSDWERFMKLTVSDIVSVGGDRFNIVFKNSNGKTYTMENISKSFVSSILEDHYTFLSFDPYKKYNWSTSTWNLIKAKKVSVGMNKDQVELSWGHPSDTSKLTSNNITVEVWRYGTQYVSFTNGTVKSIYTL